MRFLKHRKMFSRAGSGWLSEIRITLGIWFFREVEEQAWSPLMSDVRATYGVRIGTWRVAVQRQGIRWKDGKQPAWEWRASP